MIEPRQGPFGVPRQVFGVAALVHAVGDAVASRFGACTVQGEVSGWSRAASGHCYFSLKDADGADALLRSAMFRRAAALLDFAPRDGQLVTVRGRLAVYEPRGELQLVVEAMRPAGAGALYEQFLRLKARLEAEGLFDAARKRDLPPYPRRIGVVTSLGGAALHDVLTCLARRAPQVEVVVYPSAVQGPEAPDALVRAIDLAARRAEVDLLLLCRGGGSLEDLWSFNDERVVRAVAACPLPLVCGVGHETDVTLCDFAADLRAATPTAAAELAAPSRDDALRGLGQLANRLVSATARSLDTRAERLDRLALRLARPAELLQREQRRLDRAADRLGTALRRLAERRGLQLSAQGERLVRAVEAELQRRHRRLAPLAARLQSLDPSQVLQRGYAWLARPDGAAVTSAAALVVGETLQAVLGDGRADVVVSGVEPRVGPR